MHRSRLVALTAAFTLLPTAAFAHPAFNGPATTATPTDLAIVVPHGCAPEGGMPGEGEQALPTIAFDLELVAGIAVEPAAVDGWTTSVADGVVSWVAAGGETTDVIEFPVVVTVDAGAGEVFELNAFQQCSDDAFTRWNGGDWPAVKLSLVGVEDGDDDEGMDHGDDGMAGDEGTADDHGDDEAMDGEHGDDEAMDGEHHDDQLVADAGAQALAGEEADPGISVVAWALVALVVVLLGGGILAVRRGKA